MNIIFVSLVVCLLGSLSNTAVAQVTSGVFGVSKVTLEPYSLKVMSAPFLSETQTVNQVLANQLSQSASSGGDTAVIWDGTELKHYFRLIDIPDEARSGKWVDADGNIASDLIPPGTGFFIKNNSSNIQEVAVFGNVVEDPVQVQIVPGLQLLSSPYSSSFNLASNTALRTSGAVAGFGPGQGDEVFLWNSGTQEFEGYFLGDPNLPQGFADQWIDGAGRAADFEIHPGRAFYYKHAGAGFTWNEPIPYTP